MKQPLLLLLFLFLKAGVTYAQKDGPLKSAWTTTNPFGSNAGALATSSGGLPPNEVYLDKDKVSVAVSNSADKLFVTIRLDNEQDHVKALLLGSKIWLDIKGKKSTKYGIHYPLPEEPDPDQGSKAQAAPRNPGEQPKSRSEVVNRLIAQKKDMKLIGLVGSADKDEERNGVLAYAKGDPSGVTTSLEERNNQLIYNLTIPLSLLKVQASTDKPISIGFETGTLPRTPSSNNNTTGMGGYGMGGYGMGGYGYGGYGMGGYGYGGGMRGYTGGGSRQPYVQQTKFWVNVQLATQ